MSNQRAASGGVFYPGQDLGLPEYGSGSVVGWSRRLGALIIDWIACSFVTIAFYHPSTRHAANVFAQPRLWTLAVFGLQDFLLIATTGFTLGKRLLGMRVIRLGGRPVGFGPALARTLLLLLVVPAMIMDRDLRGLHDKAARTVVVRT